MSVTSDRTTPKANLEPSGSGCPECGGEITGRSIDGLCARCLMQLAVNNNASPEANREAAPPPKKLGRYVIRRKLGQGAMGVVYLAKDVDLDRFVALKLPLFGRSREAAIIERFQREIRAAASVQHPNICPIYDVGQIDGSLFMSMAFIEGRPLSRSLEEGTALSVKQAVSLVRKLALALHAAHQRGIVHRDLKPANIMIDRLGEPIIMDFGLACRRNTDDARVTTSGAIVGTPAYMSPEQVAGVEATPASDLYSLGVILYELVTTRLPLDGELVPLLNKIAHEAPEPPSTHRDGVSATVDSICLRALAKDPEDRFASAEDFARELTRFLVQGDTNEAEVTAETECQETPISTRHPTQAEERSSRQTRMLAATAGGTVLATLVLLSAYLYFANQKPVIPSIRISRQNDATDVVEPSVDLQALDQSAAAEKEDVVVNYVLGRYLCFTERDWQRGLQYLSRGADATLQQLALQDLNATNDSVARPGRLALAAGDAWAGFASQQKLDSAKTAATERAAYWYQLARDGIDEAQRERVDKWLGMSAGTTELAPAEAVEGANVATAGKGEIFDPDAAMALHDPVFEEVPRVDSASMPGHALTRYERKCLDALGSIGLRRLEMLAEMQQLIRQRDVLLPQSHLKASADYAQLVRLSEELAEEMRRINRRQGELLRMRAISDNEANRLVLAFQLANVRRERAIAMQRHAGLALEAKANQQELSQLGGKMKAINEQIIDWSERANHLVEEAFWSLEPTGSLSSNAYLEMAAVLTQWLQTTEMHPAIFALRSLAYCHSGRLDRARHDAEESARLDPSFVLATAVHGYVRFREGGAGEGISEMSRAVRLEGRRSACYLLRGLAYRARRSEAAARQDFELVVALAPDAPTGHAVLALQLAVSRDESVRDGEKSLAVAERACELSSRQSWICLTALAAARAEVGQFVAAIQVQKSALTAVAPEQRSRCEQQLRQLEAGRPLRFE